ncbi:SIS domain-containing protein [Metabacillus sp. GX 13764]|uniref:SIS domain-containing protein n=1 Tax=Metabacillus kandeliae TaxID=2900151 RepID=UPI001E2A20D2|nr:SIS domain-containing protein [Metabacillus kandeliae]MCD7032978.1 SIS domain-containing protein [Metabacillus kandeliae]
MRECYTVKEILQQDALIEKTRKLMSGKSFHPVQESEHYVFTGCGTSFYIAHSAAKFFQSLTGVTADAVPASELLLYPENILPENKNTKVIAISRSGTTTEVAEAVNSLAERINVSVLAVTCNEQSPMIAAAHESIVLSHIEEKSVVMTGSFTCMLYALQLYAAKLANSKEALLQLEQAAADMAEMVREAEAVKSLAENKSIEKVIFLGCGAFQGAAKEACLKLKEMTQTFCESYSTLEFRHGPISITDDRTAIVILGSRKTEKLDRALLEDVKKHGAYTVYIGGNEPAEKEKADLELPVHSAADDACTLVLYLPYLQMAAALRAMAMNLDPDQPRYLSQVVTLPTMSIGQK